MELQRRSAQVGKWKFYEKGVLDEWKFDEIRNIYKGRRKEIHEGKALDFSLVIVALPLTVFCSDSLTDSFIRKDTSYI